MKNLTLTKESNLTSTALKGIFVLCFMAMLLILLPIPVKAVTINLEKIDEQRAVNLNPGNLEKWAKLNGYEYTRDEMRDKYNNTFVVYTVTHYDFLGEIYKKAASIGKVAASKYAEGVSDELVNVPEDVYRGKINNTKEAATQLNNAGKSNVLTLESAKEMMSKALEEGNGLKVVASYFYLVTDDYDYTKLSATYANVIMSATGRFYGLSEMGGDLKNGMTDDGFSIKKSKEGAPGYNYKQEKITLNGNKYWKIFVVPTI